jgi:hypothetical protein
MKKYIFVEGCLEGTIFRAEMEPNNPKVREITEEDYEYQRVTQQLFNNEEISKNTAEKCSAEIVAKYKNAPLTQAQLSYLSSRCDR